MLTRLSRHTVDTHQDVPNDNDLYRSGSDIEKFEFPSNDRLIPAYSVNFRSDQEIPIPSQTRGPRFFNKLAQPFEPITLPQAALMLTRKVSDGSLHGHLLARSDSLSSYGSGEGHYSDAKHARGDSQHRRWLIE